jgi:polysaccharide pyruvyl transferase WcaK-like protein
MTDVAIIGATFHGNRGAEAMLSATIGMLRERRPDLRFNIFSYYPTDDSKLVHDQAIVIYSATPLYLVTVLNPFSIVYRLLDQLRLRPLQRLLPHSVQAMARSRALICLAGISFADGRKAFLPYNIATILPAVIVGTPVVKFAQALGPFQERLNAYLARLSLVRCTMIFARGDSTLDHLRHLLEHAGNYRRANDIAFLFKPEFSLSQPESEGFALGLRRLRALRQEGQNIVGLCPSVVVAERASRAGWDYTGMITRLIEALSSKGFVVALLANATRDRDSRLTHNNDLPLISSIVARLAADGRKATVIFDAILNAKQVHEIIAACDVVATSRFHTMVAALSLGVPVAVMGWSHKYLEVMRLFDQEDMVLAYEEDPYRSAINGIVKLFDQRAIRTKAITERLDSVRLLAGAQIDYASSLLNDISPA